MRLGLFNSVVCSHSRSSRQSHGSEAARQVIYFGFVGPTSGPVRPLSVMDPGSPASMQMESSVKKGGSRFFSLRGVLVDPDVVQLG